MKEIPDPLGLIRDTDQKTVGDTVTEVKKPFGVKIKSWPDEGVKIPVSVKK